ncbi:MAG: menaquinone biosynthetic enzyme MqnA/MqnD family protein [Bacteroidales bacterium]
MKLLRISAVSYLNTFPFVFGLQESGLMKDFKLELDVPSVCAKKLKDGTVDIALVPVGALAEIGEYHYISDFCIGATGVVKTVLLLSKVPMDQISEVHLDFDSRTSIELAKVLAHNYWKISPRWKNLKTGEITSMHALESLVAIGDKTFEIRSEFPYVYDLAEEWIKFTGLPFVFAVWISGSKLPDEILQPFIKALAFGVAHKRESIEYFRDKLPDCKDCLSYLEHNISYDFDHQKKEGLKLFLNSI